MSRARSIVDRTYEAFNARDFTAFRELLDERVELIMSGTAVHGVVAVTDFVTTTAQVRPGLRIEPGRVFVESGDTLVTEVRMIDTAAAAAGAQAGPAESSACGLYRLARGRILEWRVYTDPLGEGLASAALVGLAAEQSALRRVAELVARNPPPEAVFDAVTDELRQLLGADAIWMIRAEPDADGTVVAACGTPADVLAPGTRVPLAPGSVFEQMVRTGRPARVDDFAHVRGPLAALLRERGPRTAVGSPILLDGRLWGAMVAGTLGAEPLPSETEERIARFAELVSTALSNLEARATVERLAAEQAAHRRIATLVSRQLSPDDVFATLAEEIGLLLEVDAAAILRYEPDASATVVAGWSEGATRIPVGERLVLDGENNAGRVLRTGLPQRRDDYSGAAGPIAAVVRELGIRSAVASPIVVNGLTWGTIAVLSLGQEPLAPDTEERIEEFSRHAATAVANTKSRSDLAESRARIVRAGDEARRRFERDLHDGAQQRLVSLGLAVRATEASVPSELPELRRRLSRLTLGLSDVLDELRELSRGIHPAVLSEGGLTPALRSLARRSAVPVELDLELDGERLEEAVEVAGYYVVSEALTNSAKHARASRAQVMIRQRTDSLELIVRDDGRGGADARGGSGLTGLVDRVEAIGGTITIDSPLGGGTALHVQLPTSSTR